MHYSCMNVGPTMECGDPPRPYLDIAKGKGRQTKMITNVDINLGSAQPKLNSILIIQAYL